jgi:hypothetical protein
MWVFISSLAAGVAVVISYLQWKTAQTKVAIDIHATRYAIYQDLRGAVSDFLKDLNFSIEVQKQYMDAQSRARFHFGAEIEQYLESLRGDMIHGHTFNRYGHLEKEPALPSIVDTQLERLSRINAFYKEIDRMFVPYMRLDQRMLFVYSSHKKEFYIFRAEQETGRANEISPRLHIAWPCSHV